MEIAEAPAEPSAALRNLPVSCHLKLPNYFII